jgi:hypothetical protein
MLHVRLSDIALVLASLFSFFDGGDVSSSASAALLFFSTLLVGGTALRFSPTTATAAVAVVVVDIESDFTAAAVVADDVVVVVDDVAVEITGTVVVVVIVSVAGNENTATNSARSPASPHNDILSPSLSAVPSSFSTLRKSCDQAKRMRQNLLKTNLVLRHSQRFHCQSDSLCTVSLNRSNSSL